MVGERRDDGEDAEGLQLGGPLVGLVVVALADEVEKWVMVVIDVVNADFKDALSFFCMRFDELHPDVKVVERLHAKVVLLAVVFNIVKGVPEMVAGRDGESEVVI